MSIFSSAFFTTLASNLMGMWDPSLGGKLNFLYIIIIMISGLIYGPSSHLPEWGNPLGFYIFQS